MFDEVPTLISKEGFIKMDDSWLSLSPAQAVSLASQLLQYATKAVADQGRKTPPVAASDGPDPIPKYATGGYAVKGGSLTTTNGVVTLSPSDRKLLVDVGETALSVMDITRNTHTLEQVRDALHENTAAIGRHGRRAA